MVWLAVTTTFRTVLNDWGIRKVENLKRSEEHAGSLGACVMDGYEAGCHLGAENGSQLLCKSDGLS